MDVLLRIVLAYGGVLIGLLVLGRVAGWISSVDQAIRSGRGSAGLTALGLAAVLLLHSGPWFVVVVGGFAYVILSSPHRPEWAWLFGGMLLAPVINAVVMLRFVKLRRKRLSSPQPQPPDHH